MNKKYGHLIKNVGILTISNFSSKILIFLLVPLYTSVLTTSEYGVYDITISTVQLMLPLLSFNIVEGVMRYVMDKKYSNNDVIVIGIKYTMRSVFFATIIIMGCAFLDALSDYQNVLIFVWIYFVVCICYQLGIQFAKGLDKVIDLGVAGILSTIVILGSNLLFLLIFKWGLEGFFAANILGQMVAACYLIIRLRMWQYMKRTKINIELQKEMLAYSTPLLFTAVGWWVNNTADKYMVTLFCGIAAEGIFSVAYKIPNIINVIQTIFIQAWQISAIKEFDSKESSIFYGKTFVVVNFVMCLAASGLILLCEFIASFMFANDFFVAWKYVPFLIISNVLNTASGYIGSILSASKNSKAIARSAICGMIVNVVLNGVLIYWIGIQGACIATAISSFVIYLVRKIAVKNYIIINDYWKIYFMWLLLCVQSIIKLNSLYIGIEIIIFILLIILNYNLFMKKLINKVKK